MDKNRLKNIIAEEVDRVLQQESGLNELSKLNEISVPAKFGDEVFKVPPSKMNRDHVLKVAKKYKVDPKLAIQHVNQVGRLKLKEAKLNEAPKVAPQTRMEFGVEYRDSKGRPKKDNPLVMRFKTKAQADKYAKRGNKVDKVGGKYTVVQVPIEEKFDSKAQQRYMFATNPKAAKKLASKMTKKDYDELPDKVSKENVAPDHDGKAAPFGSGYKKVKDLEESTKAYEKALQKMARDNKLKMLSKSDKEKLIKIAQMLKKANESVNEAMNMDKVPYNTIMKMKPGSTIKMKDGKIRTKDKFGNWRADTDRNDIIVNRDIVKHMKGMKGYNAGGGRIQIEGVITERTAKDTLKDAVTALTKTFGGKKLDKRYVKDYLKSMERMARKKPMDFVKDYGDFKVADWIEDAEYNLRNEGKLTEAVYKKGQKVKYQLDKGSSKALKPSEGTISKVKKMGRYVQYTVMDGGPVPVWEPEILGLSGADKKAGKGVFEAVDINDPVLVAFRASRKDNKPAKTKARRISFDKYLSLLDAQTDIGQDIKDKAREMAQTLRDMEQEAEPEGGKVADRYGSIMMKQEKEYAKLKAKKAKIDARVEKYKMM